MLYPGKKSSGQSTQKMRFNGSKSGRAASMLSVSRIEERLKLQTVPDFRLIKGGIYDNLYL
jgi:hypothetical protein